MTVTGYHAKLDLEIEGVPPGRIETVLSGALFVIIFGSAVQGRLRPDSDLDVAVAYSKPLEPTELLELSAELSAVTGRRVDLVDLKRVGPILKMQVLKSGRTLLINDTSAYERFRMYTVSEYQDYKLMRRVVEDAVVARRSE